MILDLEVGSLRTLLTHILTDFDKVLLQLDVDIANAHLEVVIETRAT